MFRSKLLPGVTLLSAICASLAFTQSQQPPAPPATETKASYKRARQVLDAAIKAMAGEKPLPGMDAVSFQITGKQYHRNQSPRADGPPDSTSFTATLAADFQRNRLMWERTSSFPGGFDFSNRWIATDQEGTNYNLLRRQFSPLQSVAGFNDGILRRVPQYMLKSAFDRAATLRWAGEAQHDGKKYNLVSFATPTGVVITLHFDAQTNLLAKYEFLATEPLFGDVVSETAYTGYQSIGGIQLPTGQVQKLGGVLVQDVAYSAHAVNALPAGIFDSPGGFAAAAPAGAPAAVSVARLADGVFLIEGLGGGGYRVLFVEFREYIGVVEAPLNEDTSRTALRLIRETVPNKPIRFVAITHHHDDHSGGIRAYMAEGITVVTTPGNAPFLRGVIRAPFTIQPDAYARSGRRGASSDFIENKRAIFTDGHRTLQLLDIGPGPHAEEMLVAWLPREKILFQGDLMNRPPDGSLNPANETTVHFAEWLKKTALPVEKLVGVHSQPSTMADLETMIQMRQQAQAR
ncbi:MAG: MBL fold metallo-hydrolase [Candidatus Acidiferrales bacterium]